MSGFHLRYSDPKRAIYSKQNQTLELISREIISSRVPGPVQYATINHIYSKLASARSEVILYKRGRGEVTNVVGDP